MPARRAWATAARLHLQRETQRLRRTRVVWICAQARRAFVAAARLDAEVGFALLGVAGGKPASAVAVRAHDRHPAVVGLHIKASSASTKRQPTAVAARSTLLMLRQQSRQRSVVCLALALATDVSRVLPQRTQVRLARETRQPVQTTMPRRERAPGGGRTSVPQRWHSLAASSGALLASGCFSSRPYAA